MKNSDVSKGLSEAAELLATDAEWETPEARAVLDRMNRNAEVLEDYDPFREGPLPPLEFDPDNIEF